MQNKKLFEIILHVGRVTNLQSWVAKKSCNGQTLPNECLFLTTFMTIWKRGVGQYNPTDFIRNSNSILTNSNPISEIVSHACLSIIALNCLVFSRLHCQSGRLLQVKRRRYL